MVNIPLSDRSQVTSALIAFKQKTLRKMSVKIFFMIVKNKGRRLSEILVLHFRLRPRKLHNWQVRKSPCPKRTRNSSLTCSRCWKLVVFKVKRTKAKSSMYYLCRENRLSLTRIDKNKWFIILQIPVSDTDSAQGERYRSSEFVLIVLSVSYYFCLKG